jgi:hypothetical protein
MLRRCGRKYFVGDVAAPAMINILVHHSGVIALKGDSYRIKDADLSRAISS